MKRSILVSADHLIPVCEIAGSDPRGYDNRVWARLTDAVSATEEPRLSFSGISSLGPEFITRSLAPVLFEAAKEGRPALATEIDREVARQLHLGLRSVGALLHNGDSSTALGASSQLVETLTLVRRGKTAPAKLSASLGISVQAASGRLDLLVHWGMLAPASRSDDAELAIAA